MIHQIYEKKDLHICTFPSSDVYMFVEMHLRVIDRDTNTTVYDRTVCVEDQRKCHRSSYEFSLQFSFLYSLWNKTKHICLYLPPRSTVSSIKYIPSSNWRGGPIVSWMEKAKKWIEPTVWNSLQLQKHTKHCWTGEFESDTNPEYYQEYWNLTVYRSTY